MDWEVACEFISWRFLLYGQRAKSASLCLRWDGWQQTSIAKFLLALSHGHDGSVIPLGIHQAWPSNLTERTFPQVMSCHHHCFSQLRQRAGRQQWALGFGYRPVSRPSYIEKSSSASHPPHCNHQSKELLPLPILICYRKTPKLSTTTVFL